MNQRHIFHRFALFLMAAILTGFAVVTPALAAKPVLDSGVKLDANAPYNNAQPIPNVFENRGIYGKLEGDIPVDVYTFKAEQDGEQTFRLMVRPQERNLDSQPFLILVDPTNATEPSEIGLDVPGEQYHTAIITPLEEEKFYTEPNLFTKYAVVAEQRVHLTKDQTYYFVVFDIGRQVTHYAINLGDGKVWRGGDVFKNLGDWFQVKTDKYAASTPFKFSLSTWGVLIFFLGLIVLAGIWLVHELFSYLARFRTTELNMQRFKDILPVSRILFWMGLAYTGIGGYIYFSKRGFDGLPFVVSLFFIPLAAAVLYLTFGLYPELRKVTGHSRDSFSIPMRRWLLAFTIVSGISLAGMIVFLSMYLS